MGFKKLDQIAEVPNHCPQVASIKILWREATWHKHKSGRKRKNFTDILNQSLRREALDCTKQQTIVLKFWGYNTPKDI